MQALLKKRRGALKISFSDLWNHADKELGEGLLYAKAPYSMTEAEFKGYYGDFYLILPAKPTRQDLEEGIFASTSGHLMVKFFKA